MLLGLCGQKRRLVYSRVCCQSFLFISVASTQDCQTFPLYGCYEDDAFISSRLDYCNSLLAGATSGLLTKLQSVQNAAARFVTMSRKFDHITPVLRDLHWLPVRRRITFKVAPLVYKCLHGFAPPYPAEDCVLVASLSGRQQPQHLRSADTCRLFVTKTSMNYGSGLSLLMNPTHGTAFQLTAIDLKFDHFSP